MSLEANNSLEEGKSTEQLLREMSLVQYIDLFGSITDRDPESPTWKERISFSLWDRQKEACDFMENETQVILMPKSRQKGYSEIAAERALFTLFKSENTEGVAISKSEFFAQYFLEERILKKYKELEKRFPGRFPKLAKKPTKEEIVFEGGRRMMSLASSSTAAASMTLDFLIVDEAGGIDENKGATTEEKSIFKPILVNSLPALDQNPEAWAMIIGTSVPGSYYNKLVKDAYEEKNTGEYKYFFIGWHHQPGRDVEWYRRQCRKYDKDVFLQHPTDMDDFFYIRDGLVFQHLDHKEGGRHIYNFRVGEVFHRKIDDNIQKYRASWNNFFLTAYDHGTDHPAVNLYTLYDQYHDMLYVFDETFFQQGHGSDVDDINEAISKKLKEFPRKPDREIADGAIFNDVGVESVGSQFVKGGRKFKKAKKHDEAASRNALSKRFRDNKILIHPRCVNLIAQLKGYRWDAKSKGEKPIDGNDDAIDALRYACAECKAEDHPDKGAIKTSKDVSYSRGNKKSLTVGSSLKLSNDWQAY
jgi:hypothetical protein